MQPHERIDELLLVVEGGQVEEEVLDPHLVLMGGLQSHCQVHLVERALQCYDVAPHLLTILELARIFNLVFMDDVVGKHKFPLHCH